MTATSNVRVGDWILTATGRSFWPLDPRADEICIDDIAQALAKVCRFGGHCCDFYSVAQHSVLVAHLVERSHPQLALHALLHDAAEAYLGDFTQPLKPYLRVDRIAAGGRGVGVERVRDTERRLMEQIRLAF